MSNSELTTEQVARGVNDLAEAVAIDVKYLKENKADIVTAGSGINLLTSYIQKFMGVSSVWLTVDLTATVSNTDALKHIRGDVITLITTTLNTDACIFLDDSATTYTNIELRPEKEYIYSFYAKSLLAGKKLRAIVKAADGTILTTSPDPLILTTGFVRYSFKFAMPAGTTGAVLAFYPNLDAEIDNQFEIQGLMLERVVNPQFGSFEPSDFKA